MGAVRQRTAAKAFVFDQSLLALQFVPSHLPDLHNTRTPEPMNDATVIAVIPLASILCDNEPGQRTLDELMDSLLCTAIEGGSNYWCEAITCKGPKPNPDDYGDGGGPWYCYAFRAGATMTVHDGEDDGRKYVLTRQRGIDGLVALLSGKHCHADIVTSLIQEKACGDAEVADCWLQLAIFGSVVYG